MAIASYDDLISGFCADYGAQDTFYAQIGAATTATLFTGQNASRQHYTARTLALPSVPAGKTYFAPTKIEMACSRAGSFTICELTSFGSLDISGASGTFTDGSAAPTVTEGGTSRQIPSAVLAVVTTALNATPGTITITYKDQDNNTAETTSAITLTASAVAGTAGFLNLNTGDWGALDITAAARSSGTTPTGVLEFFHVRPIANISAPVIGIPAAINLITDHVRIVKLGAGTELALIGTGTTTNGIQGRVNYLAI